MYVSYTPVVGLKKRWVAVPHPSSVTFMREGVVLVMPSLSVVVNAGFSSVYSFNGGYGVRIPKRSIRCLCLGDRR